MSHSGVKRVSSSRRPFADALVGRELGEVVQRVGRPPRATRRRAEQREPLHALGPRHRQLLGHHAAEADAHDAHPVPAEGVDERHGVGGVLPHRVRERRGLGETEPALVVGDDVEARPERDQQRLARRERRPGAVAEQQRRPAALPLVVDGDPVRLDRWHRRRIGGRRQPPRRSTSGIRHCAASAGWSATARTRPASRRWRSLMATCASSTVTPARSSADLDGARRRDLTGLEHAQVPASATGGAQPRLDVGPTPVQRELEARPAGLGDLQRRVAPPPHVADAHVALEDAHRAEVLAERRRAERLVAELVPPRRQVLGRVGVDRLVAAAVHAEVGLPVAGEVDLREPEDRRRRDRLLADAAPHPLATRVGEHARRGHVDRGEGDHGPTPYGDLGATARTHFRQERDGISSWLAAGRAAMMTPPHLPASHGSDRTWLPISPSTSARRSPAPTRPARRPSSSSTVCGCCRAAGTAGARCSNPPATRRSRPAGPTTPTPSRTRTLTRR